MFTKIRETIEALPDIKDVTTITKPTKTLHVAFMRIIISLILLFAGLLILTSPNPIINSPASDGLQKIAAGWIGAVIGYWLS